MATYPIKMLKDEENKPFVPLVSTDCIRDENNQTLQQVLDKKLSPTNLLAGDYVSITTEGNNCYVNVDLPANLNVINNLTTNSAGQGALDAYQGKVLKDSIPLVVNDLSSTSTTNALSANQGYILNNKINSLVVNTLDSLSTTNALSAAQGKILNDNFNNYLPLTGTAKFAEALPNLIYKGTSQEWGNQIGECIYRANDSDGGALALRKNNPNPKQLSCIIDGYFYQNEGNYRCLDTSDLGNYNFYKFPRFKIDASNPSLSQSLQIISKGRPIFVSITGDLNSLSESGSWVRIVLYRDGTALTSQIVQGISSSHNIPFSIIFLDRIAAGTYNYSVTFERGGNDSQFGEENEYQTPNFTIFEI